MDGFDHELHDQGKQAFNRFVSGKSISARSDVARIVADYSQLNEFYEEWKDQVGGPGGPVPQGVDGSQAS
jgi:hypothetical protein